MKIKQIRTGRKIQVESKRANGHTVRFGGSKVQIRFCAFVVPWKRDKSAKNKSYYPYHHYKFRFKIVYVRSIFYFFVRQISDYIFGEFHWKRQRTYPPPPPPAPLDSFPPPNEPKVHRHYKRSILQPAAIVSYNSIIEALEERRAEVCSKIQSNGRKTTNNSCKSQIQYKSVELVHQIGLFENGCLEISKFVQVLIINHVNV